jgi:hypothetical protein
LAASVKNAAAHVARASGGMKEEDLIDQLMFLMAMSCNR